MNILVNYVESCQHEREENGPHPSPPSYIGLLHWLPIRERVKFKVACLVRQSLFGQAPHYLADDCCLVSDSTRRSLRSVDVPTCVVPQTLSSCGDRTFAAAGARLWNSLPVQLRNQDITYTDCSDDSSKNTFLGNHEHGADF